MANYKPGLAADRLYDSFWHYFCDEAIEKCKAGQLSSTLLAAGLETYLKLWQPFMPFVTQAIWQELGKAVENGEQFLAGCDWPSV
ncbi:class I tRNA ligase family protein [bacterium]|nr:class I tRNA ligase family protein [bacterium]